MKRSLLLTFDYPPVVSGIATVFLHVWKHFDHDRMLVLTSRVPDGDAFDRSAPFRPLRFPAPRGSAAGKLFSMLLMTLLTAWHVLFNGVREIHAGQILSSGPIGLLFQKFFGIPCYLWVYGGETTDAYRRSRFEERVVGKLLRECAYLVTNSPGTTREFAEYGIPRERLVEILPAVDSSVFTPGPRPERLVREYGLDGKHVLLTVARVTPRKGHDLVLGALSLLADMPSLHYVIVGSGEDRGRLEAIIEEKGLRGRVTFTGRVADDDLPDYYRLCDIYVMPNREVLDSTDSVEGFGISFIEANACGKPSIGGRSGGAAAAVEDGVTGYLVDPEDPRELAEKIRLLIEHPETASEMGEAGRQRVVEHFSWDDRARTLAERLSVVAMP